MSQLKPETTVLHFTPAARKRIEALISEMKVPEDYFLRVGMQGGGCAGMAYLLGFDSQKPEDALYEVEGIKVLMDKRHGMYLLGMEIDYVEEEDRAGFVFNNPAARKTDGS